MALLSFEQIRDSDDVTEENVFIKEWGGEVRVRSLTRRQVKDITKAATKSVGKGKREIDSDIFEKGLLFYGLVHPQLSEDELEALLGKNAGPFQKMLNKIMELSKLGDDEEEAAESLAVEEGTFPERSRFVSGIQPRGDAGNDSRGTDDGEEAASQ